MRDHTKFEVWRLGHALTLAVYAASAEFPDDERFGLVAQIRRSAASIPSNVAEGAARRSDREFARFVDIALGSNAECGYQVHLAHDLGYLDDDAFEHLNELSETIRRKLYRLRQRLSGRQQP